MYSIGVGSLSIPPSEYWNMSLQELYLACEGYNKVHGGEKKNESMTRAEYEELKLKYPDRKN